MVFKFYKNLKEEKGISLVEIIVMILLIGVFSTIIISDFPKVLRHFALSRSVYKMAQDLRKAQDLGLSGVETNNARGYGFFIDLDQSDTKYLIYADLDGNALYDQSQDPIIDEVDVSKENPDVYIKRFKNIVGSYTSINFSPPHPDIYILKKCSGIDCEDSTDISRVGIVLGLHSDNSAERTVWMNTSGLINVE